jgi:hypothetical protein
VGTKARIASKKWLCSVCASIIRPGYIYLSVTRPTLSGSWIHKPKCAGCVAKAVDRKVIPINRVTGQPVKLDEGAEFTPPKHMEDES